MLLRTLPYLAFVMLLFAAAAHAGDADDKRPQDAQNNRQPAKQPLIPDIDISYQKYVLDNGLTLVVHEDHSTPIVAVSMWYHVGSKNEKPGQHGFAHLFEHLMFQGTEHWHGEYFEPFEKAGATNMNGTTNVDRTNYYATVPTAALDMALWMESDRMGHFLGGIDQAELDEQTGVVINEKHQRGNQPYGEVWRRIPASTYPAGHPYSWPTIGSEEDLKAATLEDVRAWFMKYYGPTNATLVLSGDIEPEQALAKVKRYFGDIPAGPPLTRYKRWVAPRTGEQRETMQDRVPHARIYMIWNAPPMDTREAIQLELAGDLLAGAKNSVLYKELVLDQGIALSVSAGLLGHEIASQFVISATAKPGVSLDELETALKQSLQQHLQDGPSKQALDRSKTRITAGFLRAMASASGKASVLAQGQLYHDDPAHYQQELDYLRAATPDSIKETSVRWLSDGVFILSVEPFGDHQTHASDVDRSQLPDIGEVANLDLPEVQKATLDNGLEIRLAERHAMPLVSMSLVFDAGYAADPSNQPGLASMTLGMLDEGTDTRTALEIDAALDDVGATLSTSSSLDASLVSMSALSNRLAESLALYADIVRNPAFPQKDFERRQRQRLARIAQEKSTPTQLALRKLGPLLYGDDHPYSIPLTGSGTQASIAAMTTADLADFAQQWLRPDNATLVVVGDTTMDEIKALLKQHFGDWQAPDSPLPEKHFEQVSEPDKPRIFLLDRPGATQSTLIAGNVAPPRSSAREFGMEVVNAILGGMFNSRLNMALREDKHWSYGAGSVLVEARAQQPFFIYSAVQTDKTVPAMELVRDKVQSILRQQPPQSAELAMAADSLTRSLAGHNETIRQLAGTLAESVIYNLPADYYEEYIDAIQALTLDDLAAAAEQLLQPGAMTWIVVGDLNEIGDAVRSLDWARVQVLDGRPENNAEAGDDTQ